MDCNLVILFYPGSGDLLCNGNFRMWSLSR